MMRLRYCLQERFRRKEGGVASVLLPRTHELTGCIAVTFLHPQTATNCMQGTKNPYSLFEAMLLPRVGVRQTCAPDLYALHIAQKTFRI